jgi:threonine aldolase
MVARLADDHANARALAAGLAELPGLVVDPEAVETNMVFVRHRGDGGGGARLVADLAERGVLAVDCGPFGVRFVTHCDVGREDVARALEAAREIAR